MTLLRACWNSSSSPQCGCSCASLLAHRLWYRNHNKPSACRKGSLFPRWAPKAASMGGSRTGDGQQLEPGEPRPTGRPPPPIPTTTTKQPGASNPSPPARTPTASPYSPCGPPCPVAGSGAIHMSREFWEFLGKAGSGPEASCPPEKLLRVSLQE